MTHEDAIARLPWYASATLPPDEHAAVEAHVSTCAECTREVEALRVLRSGVREAEEGLPGPPPDGWRRMQARLDAVSAPRWWEACKSFWAPLPDWARLGLAAQAVLIVGLTIAFVRSPGPRPLATAGASSGAPEGPRIALTLAEGASATDLARLVRSVKGRVVSGPSAEDAWTVQLAPQEEPIDALIETLRRDPHVRFAARAY